MRKLCYTILILYFGIAIYGKANADEWSTADKWRQGTYTALHIADWLQTREIAKSSEWTERNIVLGENPTSSQVNWYFASTLAAHYLIADKLPPKYRKAFQYVTIGVEAGAVGHNYKAGIRVNF